MEKLQAKASTRGVRHSVKKLNRTLDLIRGVDVAKATTLLKFTNNKAAEVIGKLVQGALSNAENNYDMDGESLYVAHAYANKGPVMKRFRACSHGRAARILKRTSSVTVILMEKEGK